MTKKRCRKCKHFSEGSLSDSQKGQCRLIPPTVHILGTVMGNATANSYFPEVQPDEDWCGQFQPKGASSVTMTPEDNLISQ